MRSRSIPLALLVLAAGCSGPGEGRPRPVVVYTSIDQHLAEPVLAAFTARTGIPLLPVFDTEASKTTGLVNRLIAEKSAPRADVFWNSEIIRTIVLEREGVLEAYRSPEAESIPEIYRDRAGFWTGHVLRARAIAWREDRLAQDAPTTLEELVAPAWRGRVAVAYPLFGTTGSHVAALWASWGPERTERWLRALRANDVAIVDGNSTARDLVVAGQIDLALTDTDDVAVARARGEPLAMAFAAAEDAGTFVIPATVALVRGGPNPDGGRHLVDFLLSTEAEALLVGGEGAFLPVRAQTEWPTELVAPRDRLVPMVVDWSAVADVLPDAMRVCRDLFVR